MVPWPSYFSRRGTEGQLDMIIWLSATTEHLLGGDKRE